MSRVKIAKRSVYVYSIVIAVFLGLSIYFIFEIYSVSNLYSFKQTFQNISGLCSINKSTVILFYGNNCPSCQTELNAFINVTSSFAGSWLDGRYYGPYFCAYEFNITAYNENSSSVFAPAGSIQIFTSLSNRIPMLFIGGLYAQYYKIGGFSSLAAAEQQILDYICMSINYVAPTCRGE
ncbi:MAG: hypothetical protein M1433_02855 [Candidatus Parvarchaeota archaeon]|nr:hypothetical protein [Candidatus Parvarchaeota archaeon]